MKSGEGRATGKPPAPADKNVCATELRSAGYPACGFWGHSCSRFQELRPDALLIAPGHPPVQSFPCSACPVCNDVRLAGAAASLTEPLLAAGRQALNLWFRSAYNISDTN